MKIHEYGLQFKIQHTIQSDTPRITATHTCNQSIINKSSYDFSNIYVSFHGETLFELRYKTRQYYRITAQSEYVDKLYVKFPSGSAVDYSPWIMAITLEALSMMRSSLKSIILKKYPAAKTLPTISLEDAIDNQDQLRNRIVY